MTTAERRSRKTWAKSPHRFPTARGQHAATLAMCRWHRAFDNPSQRGAVRRKLDLCRRLREGWTLNYWPALP